MPSIDDIAAEYVERAAAQDPCYATYFSLKDFHAKALSLGAMGLDPLREALARV